jgi:hypothetical protein
MASRSLPPISYALTTAALLLSTAVATAPRASALPQGEPDFTNGGVIPEGHTHDWNLGATGARGWMYSDKMVTHVASQIVITEVADGSPAADVLSIGDVILGVGGEDFESDPRTEFGRALTAAESKRGKGRLVLTRWRDGKTKEVTIRLPVLGDYSETAPYGCEKSEQVLEQGCEWLAASMEAPAYKPNPIPRCLNALALLASGERKYLKLVEREVAWASEFSTNSFATWYYGYACLLIAEYTMATGDKDYLPGLERLALEAARGQSMVGSWGHKFAQPNGRLFGYGMMNAPGVPLTIALVAAREAGIEDEEVDLAIERSVDLLRFYVGKGAIPYGDHHPWIQTHEDNGKCGMGAVLFQLLGDVDAAEYFARMALASHGPERDGGHTGNFFNLLWSMPALSLNGELAAGAWMEEFGAWTFDLARRWDGSFAHQGPPEPRKDKYANWDATGAFLLAYALPKRELLLTGRHASILPTMDERVVARVIDDGRGWNNRDRERAFQEMSDDELLERLASWSPVVRERAAIALGRKKSEVVPELTRMLSSRNLDERIGACQALAQLRGRGAAAVPALQKCLQADDLWLRVKAAEALGVMGEAGMVALPAILETLIREPGPQDPRGMEQRYLCFVLFDRRGGMLNGKLDQVDQAALHTAIRAGLQNEDGRARSAVSNVYDQLSLESIRPLLPVVLDAIMESSPSGIMFADGVRTNGLKLLAKHQVEEGIDACVHYVRHMKQHGSQKRVPEILAILQGYGAHAQRTVPQLMEIADFFEHEEQDFPKRLSLQKAESVREAARAIQDATERPTLIKIKS